MPLLDALSAAAIPKISEFPPFGLAHLSWAFARMKLKDPPLLHSIASASIATCSEFGYLDLTTSAWAMATLRFAHAPLCHAIAASAITMISSFKVQELANIAWAFAKQQVLHHPLRAAISSASLAKWQYFKPQELANLSWACATCLGPTGSRATVDAAQFMPQGLENTAWSFETLPLAHCPLLQAISKAAIAKGNEFNAQDLANTSWAFSTMLLRDRPLMESLAAASITKIADFKQQELVTTAWSFATLALRNPQLMDAIAAASRNTIQFNPHSLAGTAWAFSTLACLNGPMLDSLACASISIITEFNSQDLGNTAWSFAVLQCRDKTSLNALASASLLKIREFKSQEIEMTLWAFAHSSCSVVNELVGSKHVLDSAGPLGFGTLISWCELHGLVEQQSRLLLRFSSKLGAAAPAAFNVAATRFAKEGRFKDALAILDLARSQGVANSTSEQIAAACGGEADYSSLQQDKDFLASAAVTGSDGSKAALLLPYVLAKARFGDATAVCEAIESFATEVLQPSRQWLKIAGGAKVHALTSTFSAAPEGGSLLEIGTYFGYSSMRLALSQPERHIVTVEVDAVHALVAQCLIMHAGLSHSIDVLTGHSKDVLPLLQQRAKQPLRIAGIFMDQGGMRFWEDLEAIIQLDILMPGSIVMADNVLKPGAPTFLWYAFFSGKLEDAHVISLEEYGMPGVEDWMAVAVYPEVASSGRQPTPAEMCELEDLEWEANRIRARAAGPGGVSFDEWKAFSAWMRRRMRELGIAPQNSSSFTW